VIAVTIAGAGADPLAGGFRRGAGRPIQEGMKRLLATVLVAGLCLGCPILDELDKGSADMDKFSPGARALTERKAKEAAEKEAKKAPSKAGSVTAQARDAASKWWSNARSLAPDETDPEVIRCVIDGKDQYMGRPDCLMRGGSVAKAKL
jgi:hypothetical protein